MAKKYLFIVDPLYSLNSATDTSLALIQEACRRKIECYVAEIGDIILRGSSLSFLAAPVFLPEAYNEPPRYLADKREMYSDEFAVIFMRKDPPVDQQFYSALLMLGFADRKKTLMLNDPDGLMLANEKLFALNIASDFSPPTLISSEKETINNFIKQQGRVVLKPLFFFGGSGIMVFDVKDLNLPSALELLSNNFTTPIIVQSYIKNARQGDKRILLLGGEPLGAMLRVPASFDHRANLRVGGSALATSITARETEIIQAIKPYLLKFGLHFVGLDMIDGFLTEINITSPTGLLQIEAIHEEKLRVQVLDYIESFRLD